MSPEQLAQWGKTARVKGTGHNVCNDRILALVVALEAMTAERDAAWERIAKWLHDNPPASVDDRVASGLTGDLAVDMAAYAGRLKARVEVAEAEVERLSAVAADRLHNLGLSERNRVQAEATVAAQAETLQRVREVRDKWAEYRFFEVAAMQLRNSWRDEIDAALAGGESND